MNIVLHELKKLLNWKLLLIVGLVSFLFYHLFMGFLIEHFPNGRPALDTYNISVEMQNKYGESMNEHEFADFKDSYQKNIEKANAYLQSREKFVKSGVTAYDEFKKMDLANDTLSKLYDNIMFEKGVDVFWELQTKENLINRFEKDGHWKDITSKQNKNIEQRVNEVIDSGGIFPSLVFQNYDEFIAYAGILVLLSMMIVITPIYLKDKGNQLIYLQHTSKIGRNLFKKKLLAGLCASFIITTLQLAWLLGMYSRNNTSMFFNANINSVFNTSAFWFDMTFFQYIVMTVVAVYILGFVMTMIVAIISDMVPNFITIIGAQVPIAFIAFFLVLNYLIWRLTTIELPMYFVPVIYTVLIAITVLLFVFRWREQKVMDVA